MCGQCNHEHGAAGSEKMCGHCGTSMGQGHVWRCSKWVCAKFFWVLGVVTLVAAWVADARTTTVWGFDAGHLFHDAIAFLILSVSLKLKRGHHCGHGSGHGAH